MATFTNFATLSYNGGSTNSNTVTGEIIEALTVTKTAVSTEYSAGEDITYVVSVINTGQAGVTDITVSDDLGGYAVGGVTVYPLAYKQGTLRFLLDGVLQAAPIIAGEAPLVLTGIDIPAGSNAVLVYEATVTGFAPLASGGRIVNTVTADEATAQETITVADAADLSIAKALTPAVITENGRITYTFTIQNSGNAAAELADALVLTDNFDPVLQDITVTYNGDLWQEGVNYTYDEVSGEFATLAGQITLPAAQFVQNADGSWTVTPAVTNITVTGTV